jgi:hypothetical protein
MPPESSQTSSRRGCLFFGVALALVVLLLAAISLGWVGQVDREKDADIPALEGYQS